MAISQDHIEKKVSNEIAQTLPLPARLAYQRPDDLFTGDITKMVGGKEIESQLWAACTTGDISKVKAVLEKNHIEINARLRSGYTLLMIAAENNQLSLVKFLLNEPNINASSEMRKKGGHTALELALQVPKGFEGANYDMARALIKASGRNINQTLLLYAWRLGKQEVANQLVILGYSIHHNEFLFNFSCSSRSSNQDNPETKCIHEGIAQSKQHLHNHLNDAKMLGIECARLRHTSFM